MFDSPASLMSEIEVAQILSLPVRRVRTMARDELLPYVDLGPETMRFHPADIAAFIEQHRVGHAISNPSPLPMM